MSELVWGIKNGDIDQVKDIIENKVSVIHIFSAEYFSLHDEYVNCIPM